jgi:Protein of unknown function (DUF4231)
LRSSIVYADPRSNALHSRTSQCWYKWLKLLELAIAATLPVVTGLGSPVWLAAAIVVFEGAQHLYQLQEHWISYRPTAEALKHKRYLYLARAGPYVGEDRHRCRPSESRADLPRARQVDQQPAANRTASSAAMSLSRSPRR